MLFGPIAFKHEDAGAEHDGHIRNVENAGPQWANPNVHEIDDNSMRNPIEEVGGAAGYEQRHSEKSPSGPATPQSDEGQGKQKQCVANTEDRRSDRKWPARTEAQESARILCVLKPKRVGEE